MDVTLSVNNESNYEMDELYINVYGSQQLSLQTIYLKDTNKNQYSFEYYVNHTYFISCGILNGNGLSLSIYDWVGSGDSSTGFNQLVNGVLSLYTQIL